MQKDDDEYVHSPARVLSHYVHGRHQVKSSCHVADIMLTNRHVGIMKGTGSIGWSLPRSNTVLFTGSGPFCGQLPYLLQIMHGGLFIAEGTIHSSFLAGKT